MKPKKPTKSTFSLAAAVAVTGFTLTTPSANAAVITVAHATSSSFLNESPNWPSPVPNRGPLNLIDGAGIGSSGNQSSGEFRFDMWLSAINDTAGWVQFDLGAVYTIRSFKVWNYFEGWNTSQQRGVNAVTIKYGATTADMVRGTIDDSQTVPDITNFAIANGQDSYPGVTYTPAKPFTARYVQFDIKSNHGATLAGLADVQFEGELPSAPFLITSISSVGGGTWELTLEGEADTAYEFRSSPTLDFTPGALVGNLTPGAVPVGAIGGPNNSLLTTDANGDGTVRMALSGNPKDFVRAQIPLPVTVFSEDFDEVAAPNLPTDWTTDANTPDTGTTQWQLGAPSAVGPPAANSPGNCVGTNLAANYGLSSDIWLRTPPIDLSTASGATLTLQHWVDIDPFGSAAGPEDRGRVRVLDASALPAVSVLETLGVPVTGLNPAGWVKFSANLTAASLGKSVVLEFVFVSDDDDAEGDYVSSGWYIDDVMVTVP